MTHLAPWLGAFPTGTRCESRYPASRCHQLSHQQISAGSSRERVGNNGCQAPWTWGRGKRPSALLLPSQGMLCWPHPFSKFRTSLSNNFTNVCPLLCLCAPSSSCFTLVLPQQCFFKQSVSIAQWLCLHWAQQSLCKGVGARWRGAPGFLWLL